VKRKILTWLLAFALTLGAALPAGAVPAEETAELIVELAGEPLLSDRSPAARAALEARQDALLAQLSALPGGDRAELLDRYVTAFNGFALRAPLSLKDDIAALDGVERVQKAASFQAPKEDLSALEKSRAGTRVAGAMAGLEDAWEQGMDGAGSLIAVIDTGLDLSHPAFSDADMDLDSVKLDLEGVRERLAGLNAAEAYDGLTAEEVWRSAKVPFAFNYASGSLDVSNGGGSAGDHGTHVAAIAAGVETDEGAAGAAPGAQLLIMKVFGGDSSSTSETALLAAVEDAVALGADVINMSLGVTSGFPEVKFAYAQALENAIKTGVVVCAAAGNEYSSAFQNNSGEDLGRVENVDVGVINAPSTMDGALSVASVNGAEIYASGFLTAGEDEKDRFCHFNDNGPLFGLRAFEDLLDLENHSTGAFEYVVIPGLGAPEDFDGVDVEGRIALIRRGELTFAEKSDNARAAGAVAAVIWNNTGESINMDLSGVSEDNDMPCIIISQEDGDALAETAEGGVGMLTVLSGMRLVEAEDGWQSSAFSSTGPLADLTLKPDLAGVGGYVYAATDDKTYGTKSGTSMASPQLAGVSAVVLQYLREACGLTGHRALVRARTLLLNTAAPVLQEDGVEYSPRKQGAGLVNAGRAVSTPVWLSVYGSSQPKAELGDDEDRKGVYTFSFTAHNGTRLEQSYRLRASVLTETAEEGRMLQQARRADVQVSFSGDGVDGNLVTVPAGGRARVEVTVRLSREEQLRLREEFPNGIYVEGFVYLSAADGDAPDLSIPMLAFYGDWGSAPLFERTAAADLASASAQPGDGNCPTPFGVLTGGSGFLGQNPVVQEEEYIPERSNALNDSGIGGGVIDDVVLDLLRDAKRITVEMVDDGGEVLYSVTAKDVVKSCVLGSGGAMQPAVFGQYESLYFDPGEYGLGDGSTFTVRITGEKLDDGPNTVETMELPVYIDGQAPKIDRVTETQKDGRTILTVTVQDNYYTAGVMVYVGNGENQKKTWPVNQKERSQAVTLELDITDLLDKADSPVVVGAIDYARNPSYFTLDET